MTPTHPTQTADSKTVTTINPELFCDELSVDAAETWCGSWVVGGVVGVVGLCVVGIAGDCVVVRVIFWGGFGFSAGKLKCNFLIKLRFSFKTYFLNTVNQFECNHSPDKGAIFMVRAEKYCFVPTYYFSVCNVYWEPDLWVKPQVHLVDWYFLYAFLFMIIIR